MQQAALDTTSMILSYYTIDTTDSTTTEGRMEYFRTVVGLRTQGSTYMYCCATGCRAFVPSVIQDSNIIVQR